MNKGKKFVIACCCVIGIGVVLCCIGSAFGGRVQGIQLGSNGVSVYTAHGASSAAKAENKTGEEELEKFDKINIEIDFADVTVQPSDHYGIAYKIDERNHLSYEVKNGRLEVSNKYSSRGVTNFTVFSIGNSAWSDEGMEREYITIYIPADSKFEDVKIHNDSGDVICESFWADDLKIKAEFGDVELDKVESKNATIEMSSGNLNVNAFADGALVVTNEYGNVVFDDIKAKNMKLKINSGNYDATNVITEELFVEDDYGDIDLQTVQTTAMKLTANSGDISLKDVETDGLVVNNEYGNIDGSNVKATSLSGVLDSAGCNLKELCADTITLTTEYGDIKLDLLAKLTDYSYDLETEYGDITIGENEMGESYKSLEEGKNKITIDSDSGNIEIKGLK